MESEATQLLDSQESESKLKEDLQASVENVEQHVEQFRDAVEKYNKKVVDVVTERPLVAIAVAFGVGYLVGKLAAHRWFI